MTNFGQFFNSIGGHDNQVRAWPAAPFAANRCFDIDDVSEDFLDPQSPYCRPDWRFLYLQQSALDPSLRRPDHERDEVIARVRAVVFRCQGSTAAFHIPYANAIASNDDWATARPQAWILTGEPGETIAGHVNLPELVVQWFADLHFDARRLLTAPGFIRWQMVGEFPQNSVLAARWLLKMIAVYRGSFGLQEALPTLEAFDSQGCWPIQLDPTGLRHGEQLKALLRRCEVAPVARLPSPPISRTAGDVFEWSRYQDEAPF